MCFNAIRENKIIAKISEFTVHYCQGSLNCAKDKSTKVKENDTIKFLFFGFFLRKKELANCAFFLPFMLLCLVLYSYQGQGFSPKVHSCFGGVTYQQHEAMEFHIFLK